MGTLIAEVVSGAAMMRGRVFRACTRTPIAGTCRVLFRLLHTVALMLVAASALLYITAALGLWEEVGRTADVFGCASAWAVNREGDGRD